MYSWDDSTSDWRRPGRYRFDKALSRLRAEDAERAREAGPRAYHNRNAPLEELTTPRKDITSHSANPLIVATDVTGSMQTWPFEIFDRLPLLYQTLSQYRPDLEVSFGAIGDAGCDQYPLQVCDFAKGFTLENQLKALYGEGGGGDAPESYGLFAYYVRHHAHIQPLKERPFLIVFGDITMHERVPGDQVQHVIGDRMQGAISAVELWQEVSTRWNVWFLRRQGRQGDEIDRQWSRAIGEQNIVHIHDELRAVDYAMALIARHWGRINDFKDNMRARQDDEAVEILTGAVGRV